ncbi:MAG: beta-ketoacyl-ACP synthase II [Bacteroides sp.]|nr:beta-ketoacyl-ACP synthase II [Bacteroides sp.]MCM1085774.1 beta-ketoacyl-ACP synthase II [Bacteroides sp.]MCM1169897.1 beta-ketoacyl-ACP synthase II [Bacteroides sp.]
MELKRVVITGMGALTPIGNNLNDYWNALLAGTSGAAPITRFDASLFKTQFACELKGFDINQFMDRKEARKHDFFSQYGIVASDEAVADSGILNDPKLDKDRVGVIWASGIGGLISLYHEVSDFAKGDGTPRFNPFFIPKMIADIAAGHISIKNGFKGPNFATVSACASSANALAEAYMYIRMGKADAFVCGGSEAAVTPAGIGGFNSMHALSTRNDDPATASRPFDKDRDGFVLGEGAGGLVLEELEHAKARGAKIYAEIVGAGLTADAYHMTAPDPEGSSVARAMRLAVEESGCRMEDVDHINTHGTSTPVGDVAEMTGILKAFGEHTYKINITSTKSCTGHLLGAAGAIEAIATAMAVKNDIVPPTINHFTDDPALDNKINYTFGQPQKRRVDFALSNTFGFGGHNVSMAFRKYVE